jgi:broad specificity phosphatase PhoE
VSVRHPTTRRFTFSYRLDFTNLDVVTSAPRNEFSITLVRHGESNWNELRLVQGQNDTAQLTARGKEQAYEVAQSLREPGFDHLLSSDLNRAAETASIIGATLGLTPESDALLRERCFGTLEGGPFESLTGDVTGVVDHVLVDPDTRPPGGESFRDVVARAGLFIERVKVLWPSQRLLVVTHGGTIRALRVHWSRTPLEGMTWDRVVNASVWTLDAHASK